MTEAIPHPPIVDEATWRAQRVELLEREKAHTREGDALSAARRRLPMVQVTKEYTFETPEGAKSFKDLFNGRRQLIVYHFMFAPEDEKGCPGCTGLIDAIGDISDLAEKDTEFVLVSRAPLAKLQKYAEERGWNQTWVSSQGSDFNFDYHVTLDPSVATVEYNYRTAEEWKERSGWDPKGETPGTSVFFRLDDKVYHTYSTYQRGGEYLTHSSSLLDITPYGRQQDCEDSPVGWPQRPTYG